MAATRERKQSQRQVDREEGEEGEMKSTDRERRRHADLHLAMPPRQSRNPLRQSNPRRQLEREIDHGGKQIAKIEKREKRGGSVSVKDRGERVINKKKLNLSLQLVNSDLYK